MSCQSLAAAFRQTSTTAQSSQLDVAEASCHEYGVLDLIKDDTGTGQEIKKVCLLDPKAERELSPEDGDGRFEYFLFGVRYSHSLVGFIIDY